MGWQDAPEVAAAPKWASAPEVSAAPAVGRGEAALAGAAQGVSMGYGDEMKAGWRSLFPKSLGGGDYVAERDKLRADNEAARKAHPVLYGAGEVAGGIVPAAGMAVATGGTSVAPVLARAALPMAAGQGAVQGAGLSNADSAGGVARDAALGGGLGVAGYGVGSALGSAGRGLSRFFRGKATEASAQAAEKAAQEVADNIKSATGSLGGEVQKGQRMVENLRRLAPDLTPEEQAVMSKLEDRLAASTREALPSQAATIEARDAELAALKSGASDALAARKAELLSPDEAVGQMKARLWRYGPVAAGTALGTAIGGPIGSGIGALAGAGSRPMVQSLRRLAKNPAVQKALADKLADAVESPAARTLRLLIERGAPPVAAQELVSQ